MGLRDDLITLVDEIREDIIDEECGLRLSTCSTVLRTWSGGKPGKGDASDEETEIEPKPRVRSPSLRLQMAAPGKFEAGDLVADKISATYTSDELDGGSLDADEEFFWLVDGDPYRVVAPPEELYLGWSVQLRRTRNRPAATE